MGKTSILIVEDELIIALSLKKELEKQQYRVLPIVSDADEAIQKAFEDKPDLIIMDILLNSDKNGFEAAREISGSIETSFIFLTGNEYLLKEHKERLNSNFRILGKPATEADIKETIHNLID